MPRLTAATVVAATAAALFLAVALLAPAADASACKALGKQCEQWSPCCMGDYCMAQPFGCMESEGCNKDASYPGTPCTPRPMCKSFREDFNDPKALIDKYNYTGNPDDARFWREYPGADHADIVDGNLVLSLQWSDKDGRGQGATLPSLRWIQYGTISARIKVAAGPGVISSFITKTDIKDTQGDEIDFEMLGGHPQEVQTNFYWNGQIEYNRGAKWNMSSGSTTDDYHVYTIDWNADRIQWLVDGNVIRTVTPKEVDNKYPRQVGRVFFSVWDGGCNLPPGTVQWAGGPTPWCKDASKRGEVPKMYVDWVEIKCATEDTNDVGIYMPKIAKPKANTSNGGNSSSTDASGSNNPVVMPPRTASGTSGSGNSGDATRAGGAAPKLAASSVGVWVAAVIAVAVPLAAGVMAA
ncbi:hypothetical protein GGF31_000884 [Allomyces arbusculus]|nr:hypothetical protein GGF31_000884 [Allomyces arbusculus]